MLDGRVKTLHPRIHGGLLARRDLPAHMAALREHGIGTIDLLVVNLYPFAQATARARLHARRSHREHRHRRPGDGARRGQELGRRGGADRPGRLRARAGRTARAGGGGIQRDTRFMLAKKVYAHTAAYDGMISNYLGALAAGAEAQVAAVPAREAFPAVYNLQLVKTQDMRYGENPHQAAAFYREGRPAEGMLARWTQLQGKELSYNNIADADAAWECVKTFDAPCLRHRQACQPLRCGRRRGPGRGLRQGLEDRPDLGLRRHPGLQPAGGRSHRAADRRQQAVRRGADRARLHARGARPVRRQAEPAGARGAARHRRQRAGLQARRRRHAAADPRPEERGSRRVARGHASWRPPRRRWTTCCSPGRWPSS